MSGLRAILFLVVSLILVSLVSEQALAEAPNPPLDPEGLSEEIELSSQTDSTYLATNDPLESHPTYSWPFSVEQVGHAIQSYQNYGSSPYFHHGIDILAPNGTDVFNRSGGQVVNVENYEPGNDLYWEVAVKDPDGYVWQYHHIDKNTIPQAIKDKFSEYQVDPVNGGFIPPDTYIGDIVYWPVVTFGYRFNHIHLNILGTGGKYLNGFEFHTSLDDQAAPEILQIGLLKENKIIPGNTVSGDYGLYVRARDLMMSEVYYLPPYRVDISLDGDAPITVWRFDDLPGGADRYAYPDDYHVVPPTCGNYDCRDFYIDLGFTTSGQRPFPNTPGLHNLLVTIWDNSGNSITQAFYWTVYSAYENNISGSIPDNGCASANAIEKNIIVSEDFIITDLNLGINVTHASRGQLQVSLRAPGDAAATTLVSSISDSYDNYDLLIDDSSTKNINDNNNDTVASPNYEADRTAAPRIEGSLDSFNGKNAQGSWILSICDNQNGTTGTVNKVKLELTGTPIQNSAIGNRIWLDENSDGLQDAGETGLPNVKVELCQDSACSTILRSTYTDVNGGYTFKAQPGSEIPGGTYTVRSTPPAGLKQTYDEDSILDNQSQVVLTQGQEYLTADFGYNWGNTSAPEQTSDGNGAIGDRVWVDANSDGLQQGSEMGLPGVTIVLVTSGTDNQFGTPDDMIAQTTSSDAAGNYIFSNLPTDSYIIRIPEPPPGYLQTGDPDHYNTLCTPDCDNQTTEPIILAPNDVFLNTDFGYTPDTVETGSVSGALWLDSDRGNDLDPSEQRLANVTISLINDLDGSESWEAGEPIIATDHTDESGNYLFYGLPASGSEDYLVWVNDNDHILGSLVPSHDLRDGLNQGYPAIGLVRGFGISAVSDLESTPVTDVGFSFIPFQMDASEGLVGDTVWLDANNNGSYNTGEGMEAVEVRLYAPGGTNLLGSTITDENGQYSFGGLSTSSSYVIQVQAATLPYPGLANFSDPDGGNNSTANITLSSSSPVSLAQDFGYRAASSPNTLTGTIWEDTDADGTLDLAESNRYADVRVMLNSDQGNLVVFTLTGPNGEFRFENLPDGTYTVAIRNSHPALNGTWHSTGMQGKLDDGQSKEEPYTITVSGGESIDTIDFGYYHKPAVLGDYVWWDANGDGVQDLDETGLRDVEVVLTITYPNGEQDTLATKTTAEGAYRIGNLLLNEDFNGTGITASPSPPLGGGDEPAHVVAIDGDQVALSGYYPSPGNPSGPQSVAQGSANEDVDFGYHQQACVSVNVSAGWNMRSVPLQAADMTLGAIFPDVVPPAYSFTTSYQAMNLEDTLTTGQGYWTYFTEEHTYQICGGSIETRDIFVSAGWNMVGPFEGAVEFTSISSTPAGILEQPLYGFEGAYLEVTTLQPGEAYWAYVTQDGTLHLDDAEGYTREGSVSTNNAYLLKRRTDLGRSFPYFRSSLGYSPD